MYRITLINKHTNKPHTIDGHEVSVLTSDADYTTSQLMRNRNPELFEVQITDCED